MEKITKEKFIEEIKNIIVMYPIEKKEIIDIRLEILFTQIKQVGFNEGCEKIISQLNLTFSD